MIEFIRYLKGYVLIKVWGFAPERFFNLCAGKNILLWNIRKEADAYYMCISLSGFKSLRKIAKKNKNKGSHTEAVRTTFFDARTPETEGSPVRALPCLLFLVCVHPVCMGNFHYRQ